VILASGNEYIYEIESKMHNGEFTIKYQVSSALNTKRMSSKTKCYAPANVLHLDVNIAALWLWLN